MSYITLRSRPIKLVGFETSQIVGAKLPSNRQVLSVLFYNIHKKLSVSESARLVIDEVLIFWKKSRIITSDISRCVKKITDLYQKWRNVTRNPSRQNAKEKEKINEFCGTLDDLFDIAHGNALALIPIEEDRVFLKMQREKGRPGCMAGIDRALFERETRRMERDHEELRKQEEKELQRKNEKEEQQRFRQRESKETGRKSKKQRLN